MLAALTAVSATVTLALTGAMAGLCFAFSISVMRGLDLIAAEQAIRAMQGINRKIQNPVFLTAFVGAPLAAALTGGLLLWDGRTAAGVVFFLAAASYALGALAPTAVVNVPMNEALDAAAVPTDPGEAARLWSAYSTRWTRWSHRRALFSALSLLLVGLALFVWGRQG
jgi:uncharacterized membrane protein